MPNPVLNEKALRGAMDIDARESASGWAAPGAAWTAPGEVSRPPLHDGPISPFRPDRLTVGGVARSGLILFGVLVVGAVFGWVSVKESSDGIVTFPAWVILPALIAFGLAIFTHFKPKLARFTGPVYALFEGLFLGAISHVYEAQWGGIVTQAVLGTAGVFVVMFVLYTAKIIKVTDRFRKMVFAATAGIALIYLVGFVARLFGGNLGFINSPSITGIAFSVLVVGIAAFNLALDFDMIEQLERSAAPRWMEWYAAFGLMVTVVWLYLEILRLLSKLNRR